MTSSTSTPPKDSKSSKEPARSPKSSEFEAIWDRQLTAGLDELLEQQKARQNKD